MTQLAAFDSPIATFLDREIRDQKNYPMVCQSLQAVAAFLRFDWNEGTPYRDIFRARLFDFWAKLEPPAESSETGDGELVHRPRPLQQPDPARVRLCGLGRSPGRRSEGRTISRRIGT